MMMGDAKKKVLEELMGFLDHQDGKELGDAMKPKGVGLEVTKVQKLGDDGKEPDGDEGMSSMMDDKSSEDSMDGDHSDKPKMSDEEMEELIQALQSKLS